MHCAACPRAACRAMPDVSVARGDLTLLPGTLACGPRTTTIGPKESALLETLMRASGRVVPRDALLDAIHPVHEPDGATGTLRVQVWRVRRKLAEVRAPVTIKAVHRFGYRIEAV